MDQFYIPKLSFVGHRTDVKIPGNPPLVKGYYHLNKYYAYGSTMYCKGALLVVD